MCHRFCGFLPEGHPLVQHAYRIWLTRHPPDPDEAGAGGADAGGAWMQEAGGRADSGRPRYGAGEGGVCGQWWWHCNGTAWDVQHSKHKSMLLFEHWWRVVPGGSGRARKTVMLQSKVHLPGSYKATHAAL